MLSPSCRLPGVQHCSKQSQLGGVPAGHAGAGGGDGGAGAGVAAGADVESACPCTAGAHAPSATNTANLTRPAVRRRSNRTIGLSFTQVCGLTNHYSRGTRLTNRAPILAKVATMGLIMLAQKVSCEETGRAGGAAGAQHRLRMRSASWWHAVAGPRACLARARRRVAP